VFEIVYNIFACFMYCNHQVHRDFLITLYKGNLLPSDCRPLTVVRENLFGHKFKDDHKVEKELIRWLKTGARIDINWEQSS
jgi:hypothetical protein